MSEQLKHTPGPWITKGCSGIYQTPDIYDKGGNCIAYLDSRGALASKNEMLANANLIAAAPDLLEAITAFLNSPSEFDDAEVIKKIHKALAKAKGEDHE